jgi:hypothetical protein
MSATMQREELLTAVEAREYLRVSRQKFATLAKQELKAHGIPNTLDRRVTLYPKSVLDDLRRNARPPSNAGRPQRRRAASEPLAQSA